MEVQFATKKLANALSNDSLRVRAFGPVVAKRLGLRLAQLAATPVLADTRSLPGRCHELHGDREGQLALDVTDSLRLVFRPTAQPAPTKLDGGLDWSAVADITILEVTDYHGD